jgi:hypothetical protein
MRDAVNLSDIAFKQGYTYQGVYLCENGELYGKLSANVSVPFLIYAVSSSTDLNHKT